MRICIPVYDGVNMLDVAGPMEMFFWAEIDVVLVAEKPGTLRFMSGVPFIVERGFSRPGKCDAMWVPGGKPSSLKRLIDGRDRRYLDFLAALEPKVKITASVCEGALLLAAAALLDGYKATTHWAFEPCFAKHYPKVTIVPGHPRYCLDRDRLTGGGISSGLDEALKLIELLKGRKAAEEAQLTTQYFPKPPVRAVIPRATSCPVDLH
jgi:transcriptional regulator GlxA family with amidase domain